jgi:hypothetical protein
MEILAGHVERMVKMRNTYKMLVKKPEGMRPLGRPKLRWEDNIRMDLRETGWEVVYWIHVDQDKDDGGLL